MFSYSSLAIFFYIRICDSTWWSQSDVKSRTYNFNRLKSCKNCAVNLICGSSGLTYSYWFSWREVDCRCDNAGDARGKLLNFFGWKSFTGSSTDLLNAEDGCDGVFSILYCPDDVLKLLTTTLLNASVFFLK